MTDNRLAKLTRRSVLGTTGVAAFGAGTATAQTREKRRELAQTLPGWPDANTRTARRIMNKYGLPDGVAQDELIWYDTGPWQKTVVFRESVPHNFPMEHPDHLEQFIPYDVPVDMYDELAAYDGSVMVERTKGVISARCDKEPANFLAINLAHDIVTEERSVEEARQAYGEIMMRLMDGEEPDYTQGFQFDVPEADETGDPDEAIM